MTKRSGFVTLSLFLVSLAFLSPRAAQAGAVEFEEDFSLPLVYLNIVLDVGSAHDPADKLGRARVASQMLLRGTQKRDKSEFFRELNKLGGQLEAEVRPEGTVYRAAVLSENLPAFLDLVTEALTRPRLAASELEKLKREVEGQILAQKGDDRFLVAYHFQRFFFGSHPYGNPTNGTRKGVSALTQKDVQAFYEGFFGPKAMHLFGTGAVKKQVLDKWFDELSGKLTAMHPGAKAAPTIPKPDFAKGRRALIVNKPKATQAQLMLGGPGIRPEFPGYYAVELANHTFGGGNFQSVLMQEVRVKRGWTYGASNSIRFGRQPRTFAIHIFPKTTDTVPAINLLVSLFESWLSKGITKDQYEFSKKSLVNNAPFNYDTPKKRLENRTTEYFSDLPSGFFRDFAAKIEKVRYGELIPALSSAFNTEDLTLVVVGDAPELRPGIAGLAGFGQPTVKDFNED